MSNLTQMYNPPHPGEVLKELWLAKLNLSITDTAKALGVSRVAISEIINGRRRISAGMAFRLSKAFNTTPEVWINMQTTHDLWKVRKESISFLDSVQTLVD